MTDPQDDVPCRGCETEGPPAALDGRGLCRDCRTPAGRLTIALAERGIKVRPRRLRHPGLDVLVGTLRIRAKGVRWSITEECAGGNAAEAAAVAIAAIVQAPGLRAERDLLAEQLRGARAVAGEDFRKIGVMQGRVDDVAADRDTLATRIATLEAENARLRKFVDRMADECEQAALYPRETECIACGVFLVGCKRSIPCYEGDALPDDWTGEWAGFDACDPCADAQAKIAEPTPLGVIARSGGAS